MANLDRRRTVLLVEDDPDYACLLQESFAEAGFDTLQAINGDKALQLIRKQKVDLVVSDFMMPELNGLELCRVLSGEIHGAELRVVLYSANTDPKFRAHARELGAVDYLPRTEDTEGLVGRICALVGWDRTGDNEREQLPEATRIALDAVRQAGGDLQRLLAELERAVLALGETTQQGRPDR